MARMVSDDEQAPREIVRPHSSIPAVRSQNQQEVTEKIRRTKKMTADNQFFKQAQENAIQHTQKIHQQLLSPQIQSQPVKEQQSPVLPIQQFQPQQQQPLQPQTLLQQSAQSPQQQLQQQPSPKHKTIENRQEKEIKLPNPNLQVQMQPIEEPQPLPTISQKKELPSTSAQIAQIRPVFPSSTIQIRPLSAQARKGAILNNYFINQVKPKEKEEQDKIIQVENYLSKQSPYQYLSIASKDESKHMEKPSQSDSSQQQSVKYFDNLQKKFTIFDLRSESRFSDAMPQSVGQMIDEADQWKGQNQLQLQDEQDTRSPILSQKQTIKEQKLRIRSAMNFFAPTAPPRVQFDTVENKPASRPVITKPTFVKRYTLKDLE